MGYGFHLFVQTDIIQWPLQLDNSNFTGREILYFQQNAEDFEAAQRSAQRSKQSCLNTGMSIWRSLSPKHTSNIFFYFFN